MFKVFFTSVFCFIPCVNSLLLVACGTAPEFLLSSCEMCLLVVDGVLITSTVWTWSCSAVLRCCESTWLHVALWVSLVPGSHADCVGSGSATHHCHCDQLCHWNWIGLFVNQSVCLISVLCLFCFPQKTLELRKAQCNETLLLLVRVGAVIGTYYLFCNEFICNNK